MSRLLLNKVAAPSTPANGKTAIYVDTVDGKVKALDDGGVVWNLADSSGRNLILNGAMEFAQRQVLTTLTTYSQTASRIYAADRWFLSNENASVQFASVDTSGTPETNLTARYYGSVKKITSTGKFLMGQVIEGMNTMPLRGRYVRFSCKMRYTPNAMTVRLGLAQLQNAGTIDTVPGWAAGVPSGTFVSAWGAAGTDPTLGTNVALIAPTFAQGGTISGNAISCVLTTNFVQYSGVFLVPSNCKNLIPMVWTNGQPVANDLLHIGEISLSDGYELIDWTPRLVSDSFPQMLRYYHKSFPLLTVPAQSAGLTGAWRGGAANAGAVAIVHGFIPFPVVMRTTPTITFYNPSAANAFLRYIITPSDATATSATQVNERGTEVTATGLAAWIAGGGIAIHYQADAEL